MTRTYRRKGYSGIPWFTWSLAALACTAAVARPALAESVPPSVTPEQIVPRLAATVTTHLDNETESLIKSLQGFREAAIPAITAGLAQKVEPLSLALTRALGGIGGDAATSLLVQLVGEGPSSDLASAALGALGNRPVRRPLSAAELGTLNEWVRKGNVVRAGGAAIVLGNCAMVPPGDRLAPILERFESEVASPSEVLGLVGSYVSPRVFTLNQFLLGVSYIGKEAIPVLEQRRQGVTESSEMRKWLTLALGMAGDESVADDLADMALVEPDRYVRAEAVRAYARSAKQKAVPLLESLLTDTTESEYGGCLPDLGPVLLIRMAAMGELSRLKQEQEASAK